MADDRYLPKDQAVADCQWCPRNFLCEVRSDWFDTCGPYRAPERRRYARLSVENPLPQLFQDILEKKLVPRRSEGRGVGQVLVQKLDPHCDLYQAPGNLLLPLNARAASTGTWGMSSSWRTIPRTWSTGRRSCAPGSAAIWAFE